MKTSELTGAALDWAVAKCEGMPERIVFGRGSVRDTGYCVERPNGTRLFYVLRNVWNRWFDKCETHPWGEGVGVWTPSTNWAQGGPIIKREKIDICWDAADEYVLATKYLECEYASAAGPDPLTAAMRCYVASKLGDEVEVPAELED